MMNGHWHVIPLDGALNITDEHEAWHASGEPCILCGAIRWTEGGHHRTSSGLPLAPCMGRKRFAGARI